MKDIRIIQYVATTDYAVFILDNFLDDNYRNKIINIIKNETQSDSMGHKTNVKANMTSYNKLLSYNELRPFFDSVIEYLNIIIQVRSINPPKLNYKIDDAWGIKHLKGEFTTEHSHLPSNWSAVYYPQVPGKSTIFFSDFKTEETIKENSLYLFPGSVRHKVLKQDYDEPRYSLAMNICTEFVDWA